MIDFNVLWKGKYSSVVSPVDHPYESMHENDIIMCLPIIKRDGREIVGIRKEHCPPYLIKNHDISENNLFYTILSGKIEDGEDFVETLIREVREESGIIAKKYDVHLIGHENMQVCKSTDMRCACYFLDIYSYEKEEPKGDGTINEELSKTIWVESNQIDNVLKQKNIDFLLFSFFNFYKWRIKND